MRLIYKILLGYFLVVSIIGVFSTSILVYNIEKHSQNLGAYREREMTSFSKVIDAFIPDATALENVEQLQKLFTSTTQKLPHIKRLALYAQDTLTQDYIQIVSSQIATIGSPSHKEDRDAITNNETTLLYENVPNGDIYLDITYPILNEALKPIASLGITVSLKSSDAILQKSINKMKRDAIDIVILAIIITIVLALLGTIIISKKIISPIEKLKRALVSASKHELNQEIVIDSDDEIGELADEFNKMTRELNHLYKSMEKNINTKTKALEKQFFTDTLTRLPNRYALFERTHELPTFHLAILDVSSFKDINDVYGVDIGNKVLRELTSRYSYYLSDTSFELYRLSGDEMVILNPDILQKDSFIKMIHSIIKKIEHDSFYFEDDDIEINLSLHVGISFEKSHATEKANIALIKAKSSHSDYKIFNPNTDEEKQQVNSIEIISKIKSALQSFGIIVYYQAIVDKQGKTIKYEALVRMRDHGKIISPYFFLDVAKKTKYYQEITKAVVFMALKEFQNRDELLSINLCAEDIVNPKTQAFIKEQLAQFPKPKQIVFELVESEDIHVLDELADFISYIKETGAKVAIDDFGTGYSNFANLMDLDADYLKIDGSLIKNIDTDERSQRIVSTIISFAHNLNIKVIAEYVHSKDVLRVCRALGVDEFQGYYYSEPSFLK